MQRNSYAFGTHLHYQATCDFDMMCVYCSSHIQQNKVLRVDEVLEKVGVTSIFIFWCANIRWSCSITKVIFVM